MNFPFRLYRQIISIVAIAPLVVSLNQASTVFPVLADDLDDINKQISQKQAEYQQTESKLKEAENSQKKLSDLLTGLQGKLGATSAQMEELNTQVAVVRAQLTEVETKLSERQSELMKNETIRDQTIRSYYVQKQVPPMQYLLTGDFNESSKKFAFQQAILDKLRNVIEGLNQEVAQYQEQKAKVAEIKTGMEKTLQSLASLKIKLSSDTASTNTQITQVEKQKSELKTQLQSITDALNSLSAKQQALLASKSGSFTTSVGDVPLADDPKASPTYNPGFSPAFAAFSFGAYSHRNGMSQYGALGRANSGQTAEQMLARYYPGANLNKNYGVPATISVQGYGEMPFEDQYMNRIYEMPSDWPMEALKAQAVAARSYAIRSSKPICTTEACQVYKDSDKPERWKQAVRETRGWVLEGGPSPQYSSTTGGYLKTSGWDTTSGDQGTWTAGAYEKVAGSPWFYKSWYTQSYSISSGNCGQAHPWLTQNEFADIINAYLVLDKSGVDTSRISPTTTSCWPGNPYSAGELSNLANTVGGGAVTSISSVGVSYSSSGTTATVTVFTNRGSISIDGASFKQVFNLRAPGYISIRSPLFNIEKK